MCGIFAYIGTRDDAPDIVFDGIKLLEYRGYDSWGVAFISKNGPKKILFEKHTGKIGNAVLKKHKASQIAFGHTRWATHGGVTDKNAHPHFDCKGAVAVIHNGIVENYHELKEKLFSHGHIFKSETDTEVIGHLIEEKLKKTSLKRAVFDTFNSLVGSNAICILDLQTETIVACRNGSPLVVGTDSKNKQYFLGSDVPAFLKYTNKVHFLSDNEAVEITKDGIKLFDLKTGIEKKMALQTLDWQIEDAEKGGYPHFLIKEINDQKQSIVKTAVINEKELLKIANLINKGCKVVLTGCGTASYCTLAGKHFLASVGIQSQIYGAYEFLPFAKFCDKKTIVIGISQSGETADTLIALREAKKYGAHIAAIVNARGSTMERLADIVIPVGAGPEIAVVSTKAFTAQLATLYLLAKMVKGEYKQAKKQIEILSKTLKNWVSDELNGKITKLAKALYEKEHIYVVGKHLNYPAALEFALKIKETAYIHAEPFTAGELKHGVITLIQKGTPCFVLASNDEVKNEVLSSAAELKARGGHIIGIAPFDSPEFDEVIKTPNLGELTLFGNIIVGQLLGYYLGIGRGTDPDKPRNLAKSVTVK